MMAIRILIFYTCITIQLSGISNDLAQGWFTPNVVTLQYVSETWAWNEGQRSRILAVKMSYLRCVCNLNRMEVMKVCVENLESVESKN